MSTWLLDRLFSVNDQPVPRFAFQGTVNWMRALAILVDTDEFDGSNLRAFYSNVPRRTVDSDNDTYAYESILLALHNVSALHSVNESATNRYDIVREAIIAWYYAVYNATSAMVLAASGSNVETHSGTAKAWHNDIVLRDLAVGPFALHLGSVVPVTVNASIESIRGGNPFDLNNKPTNEEEAWGATYSYLKGTAGYERERAESRVRKSKEFKDLNVDNFRTKAARAVRDNYLNRCAINFLVQAFRYRGKANYRDSIYLSYGDNRSSEINQLTEDLESVALAYLRMASHYVRRRVERGTWDMFVADVDLNARISVDVNIIG